jgi:hypothetical protein
MGAGKTPVAKLERGPGQLYLGDHEGLRNERQAEGPNLAELDGALVSSMVPRNRP